MKLPANHASWIWKKNPENDEYVEFIIPFQTKKGRRLTLYLSSQNNYTSFLNGSLLSFSQYPTYESHPVMDKIEFVTEQEENVLAIVVYSFGNETSSVYPNGCGGLYFLLLDGDEVLQESNPSILCRLSTAYASHERRLLTPQLGYNYHYLCEKKENPWEPSVIVNKTTIFSLRETKKLELKDVCEGTLLRKRDHEHLFDLGKENVGFLNVTIHSSKKQQIKVHFVEHLVDGEVQYIIQNRCFETLLEVEAGDNHIEDFFFRLGCRYLEFIGEAPFEVAGGLRVVRYPFVKKEYHLDNPLWQKIYDTSVYTLECCYHEHYEDCPWREQAFYALDSRNQMLCGYDAFENVETARAGLKLISQDFRQDGLLSITFPAQFSLTIPSFSLHYLLAVWEYYEHTKDLSLLQEVEPKLQEIIHTFLAQRKNNIVDDFRESYQWNFYEWADGLDGTIGKGSLYQNNVVLNCLFLLALKDYEKIEKRLGRDMNFDEMILSSKKAIRERFYSQEKGCFVMAREYPHPSVLGNSLAILAGAIEGEEAKLLSERLKRDSSFTPITLSMKGFFYDALLLIDPENKDYVLHDIETTYQRMLDEGATTFWETEKGWHDFSGAGSLCHGWSALPIHYYHLLLK